MPPSVNESPQPADAGNTEAGAAPDVQAGASSGSSTLEDTSTSWEAYLPETVGVGPWEGPWPDDERYDPELLRDGDRRNVMDHFRYLKHEAIVAELDSRRIGLHIAIENIEHDMNMGSVVRTANAFNVAGVHIVGRKRWNRRGAMVTDRYLHVHHHPDAESFVAWARAEALPLVGIDNLAGAVPMETFAFPDRMVMVFGQEGPGLSPELCAELDHMVLIDQQGSTRSLNVGAAAAIAMFAWRQSQQ